MRLEGFGLDHCVGRLALVCLHNYSIIWTRRNGINIGLGNKLRETARKRQGGSRNKVLGRIAKGMDLSVKCNRKEVHPLLNIHVFYQR